MTINSDPEQWRTVERWGRWYFSRRKSQSLPFSRLILRKTISHMRRNKVWERDWEDMTRLRNVNLCLQASNMNLDWLSLHPTTRTILSYTSPTDDLDQVSLVSSRSPNGQSLPAETMSFRSSLYPFCCQRSMVRQSLHPSVSCSNSILQRCWPF